MLTAAIANQVISAVTEMLTMTGQARIARAVKSGGRTSVAMVPTHARGDRQVLLSVDTIEGVRFAVATYANGAVVEDDYVSSIEALPGVLSRHFSMARAGVAGVRANSRRTSRRARRTSRRARRRTSRWR